MVAKLRLDQTPLFLYEQLKQQLEVKSSAALDIRLACRLSISVLVTSRSAATQDHKFSFRITQVPNLSKSNYANHSDSPRHTALHHLLNTTNHLQGKNGSALKMLADGVPTEKT
jgi:hypothetical protein